MRASELPLPLLSELNTLQTLQTAREDAASSGHNRREEESNSARQSCSFQCDSSSRVIAFAAKFSQLNRWVCKLRALWSHVYIVVANKSEANSTNNENNPIRIDAFQLQPTSKATSRISLTQDKFHHLV